MPSESRQLNPELQLTIEHISNPDRGWLQQQWQNLELRSNNSVFLSWLWIGTWLETLTENVQLVIARHNQKVIGLGLFAKKRALLGRSNGYYLHKTGNRQNDQIWIEYNDYLMDAEYAHWLRSELNRYVMGKLVRGKGLYIGASPEGVFNHAGLRHCNSKVNWEAQSFRLNLQSYSSFDDYVKNALSSSSRYQIRRSIKKYQQHQPLQCYEHKEDEIDAFFEGCAKLHITRWQQGSGFKNPKFCRFHRAIVKKGVRTGVVKLYRINAGEHLLGYVYNFEYHNRVYFYLSAFDYRFTDKHLKPGLVSHYLLIEDAMNRGLSYYDFLGGESQYKKTLSDERMLFSVVEFRNKTVPNMLRKALLSICRPGSTGWV